MFNHDTLHAGEEVYSGVKYIFRTGIMFRQVENLSDPNKGKVGEGRRGREGVRREGGGRVRSNEGGEV